MRKAIIMLALCLTTTVASAQQSAPDSAEVAEALRLTAPGKPCPDFTLKDYKDKEWHLSDFKDKYLVIDFWATWCGVCIENLPSFAKLASQYEGDSRIQFITISIDSRDAQKRWMYSLPRHGLMKLVNLICPKSENDFANAFGVRGVPRYVIIGPDGVIIDDAAPTPHDGLDDKLQALLEKKGQ